MDAIRAEDVRDLVRIRDHGGRPERQDEARQLVRQELHRLDVHVGVDEARDDVPAVGVGGLPSLVRPDACDHAVDDGDVDLEPLAGEGRQDTAAAHDEIGGLVPRATARRRASPGIPRTITAAPRALPAHRCGSCGA